MNAMWSFETSVNIYQLTRGDIPENFNLQQRHCEKLKAHTCIGYLLSMGTSSVDYVVAHSALERM
jgi:hypothetical protein